MGDSGLEEKISMPILKDYEARMNNAIRRKNNSTKKKILGELQEKAKIFSKSERYKPLIEGLITKYSDTVPAPSESTVSSSAAVTSETVTDKKESAVPNSPLIPPTETTASSSSAIIPPSTGVQLPATTNVLLPPEATPVVSTSSATGAVKEGENDCMQLFDPCTKQPIANLEALEKRIRELKRQANITPIGLYELSNNTTNYEFLTTVFVNKDITLDDMVSFRLSKERLAGTDIFEVLSRLFVFFGGIDEVNPRDGGNYKFMDRAEGGKIYSSAKEALNSMKCIASKGSGISDITLINVNPKQKDKNINEPYCESDCIINDKHLLPITKTYLMSVKWRPKKEKNAEYVDLEKLRVAQQELLSAEQRPADSIVFIKSKTDFQITNNRMYRQYVINLAKTFFGWEEDVKPFLEEVRRTIFNLASQKGITPKEALETYYFVAGAKPILSLQLHQDIIVKGLCDRLETSDENLYLIGVLPRGGKTFIAGGIIREYLRKTNITNLHILWLTAAPNETLTQVRDDLIDRYDDFSDFEFVDIREGGKKTTKPHAIFFCSSQLLIASEKPSGNQRIFLQKLKTGTDKLSLVFFDEAHKTGSGDITKDNLDLIIKNYIHNLPIIFLTATYYNILFDYQVQKDNTFIWDYTDILTTRTLAIISEQETAIDNLRNRFGKELVDSIITKRLANNETYDTMAKAYIGFPDLYFLSCDFNEEAKERFALQDKYRPDSGFSLGSIFAIKPVKQIKKVKNGEDIIINPSGISIVDIKTADNKIKADAFKIFENLDNPRNMISLITPTGTFNEPGASGMPLTKEEGSSIEPSILGRINNMSRDSNSRFRLDERPTLLMFMPVGGIGSNIFYLLCAWASLLMNHSWWKERYEVACVVTEEALTSAHVSSLIGTISESSTNIHIINKNPKASIITLERTLHCGEKKKGLVILAGEKLSMGISLPCTDVVFLLNEKKTPDDIIQKMYRALTPSDGKKSAYVVDLNPVRTLAAIYGYTRASHEELNTKSEILDIIYDTYTWDADVFDYSLKKGSETKPLSFQERLQTLFEKAETDKEYKINEDIGGFEKKLAENIRKGLNPEFISKIMGAFNGKKIESALPSIGLKEGSSVSIDKTGKLIIKSKVPNPPQSSSEEGKEDEEDEFNTVEIKINNFIGTLTDFVKYLAITSTKPTLDEALADYETKTPNSEGTVLQSNVIKLVRARTVIEGIISDDILSNLFVTAIKNFGHHSSVMVYRQMKSKVDERSVRKDKILNIIHKRLTPKQTQKKAHGEVFTPIELIEDMMAHLPKKIWSDPDLKWIDPANGIGNFPVVVFYKLDEGLKGWESDEKKRRKHIIEKMLFMIELQSNNNRVAKNIFKSLCDNCEPNILTLDSVETNKKKEFTLIDKLKKKGFPEKYDIVMGNPPFQKGRNASFYVYFINLANVLLKDKGYLLYVIPNKILILNDANDAIRKFNPLFIYHTVNKEYFPSIATTTCAVICKKETYTHETRIKFENGEMLVNLETPTPTQYNDIKLKEISDKILFGNQRRYLETTKDVPTGQHIYISRVWVRYSPDKPAGGTHVFKISDSPLTGDDGSGRYISIPTTITKATLIWFLSRSKAMRFITKIYAGAMNVPAFIWNLLPNIPLKDESDADVYRLLGLNATEQKVIVDNLNDNIEVQEETTEGGSRKSIGKTRKLKRN